MLYFQVLKLSQNTSNCSICTQQHVTTTHFLTFFYLFWYLYNAGTCSRTQILPQQQPNAAEIDGQKEATDMVNLLKIPFCVACIVRIETGFMYHETCGHSLVLYAQMPFNYQKRKSNNNKGTQKACGSTESL